MKCIRPKTEQQLNSVALAGLSPVMHRKQQRGPMEDWEAVRRSRKAEWYAWCSIKQRCQNPNYHHYADYGGRGITVCDRWETFKMFYLDMGPRPSPKHSINRIDNNLGYFPENCEWATIEQQCRNRRSNRLITHNGVTKTLIEWAHWLGLSSVCLRERIDNWGQDKAFSIPKLSLVDRGRVGRFMKRGMDFSSIKLLQPLT